MTATWLCPFRVAGRVVAAEAVAEEGRVRLIAPDSLHPLARALDSAWLTAPARMLDCLRRECGQAWKGCVAYTYAVEEPEEIPYGAVRCRYSDEELIIREAEFAAALWMARAAWEEGLRRDLPVASMIGHLRWRHMLRLPRELGAPFSPTFALDIADARDGAPVARLLSDGEAGRIRLFRSDFRETVLDLACAPLVRDADGPEPVRHPPFRPATLEILAAESLASHALTGIVSAIPPGHPDADFRLR